LALSFAIIPLQAAFLIIFLIILLFFPTTEHIKIQDIEIKIYSPPVNEFILSPAIIEEAIKLF
jgi:hypothetical protein